MNTSFTDMIATRRIMDPRTTQRTPPPGSTSWGGSFDLLLVVGVMLAVLSRTPVGGLAWYAASQLSSEGAELPSLTAYFSSEAAFVAPSIADLEMLPPETSPPAAEDPTAVPEPWRSAVRTSLGQGLPPALKAQLVEEGRKPTPDQALQVLDTLWVEHENPAVILEIAAIGEDLRERAIARAIAAGEWDPERYEGHRRYLSTRMTREADRFVAGTMALATVLHLEWPVRGSYTVSSPYGYRLHPVLKKRKFHNGLDMRLPIGTPLYAAQAGRVELIGNSSTSGKYIVLDHGHGVRTSYSHLDGHEVKRGDVVESGELIGTSGNTGMSTGPHLHFVVRIGGRSVDPARFRPKDDV
ncbi:MAG: M23 family metallopeptidase [Myxococcales bacterium]|nr:M23 family metallopeptidase [Myxococcales bacterium]